MVNQVELAQELAALTERVAAIEERLSGGPSEASTFAPTTDSTASDTSEAGSTKVESHQGHRKDSDHNQQPDDFWALNGLASRLKDHPSTAQGAVMLVGALHLSDGPISWQQTLPTVGMLESDWSELAAAFSALGHPVRLELLRHILNGTHSTADLASLEDLGTTGQLHHHLRQLVTAGWVRQSGRGQYEVPAQRVVPLLACLAGAER